MFKDIEYVKCPFCSQGNIELTHFLGATKVKIKKTATFGSQQQKSRSSDTWIVTTPNCPVCKKTSEEILKKLKEDGSI